jgi:hypothetical protein
MDEKLWHSHKVYNYTSNFMATSRLLQLTILWHLSKATRIFLITCVHYNHKWITNSIIDYPISSIVNKAFTRIVQDIFVKTLVKTATNITITNKNKNSSLQGNVEVIINKELMAIHKENKHVVVQNTTQTIMEVWLFCFYEYPCVDEARCMYFKMAHFMKKNNILQCKFVNFHFAM